MAQVEVNEQNIILFGLVQLTGNSSEDLMRAAKEAEGNGYILAVTIPDDKIDVNIFEHMASEPAADEEQEEFAIYGDDKPLPHSPTGPIVQGIVVETVIIEDKDE